ncbi:hypothetical protein [Sporomusa acidovorans]|uniref:FlxA-like protein n=1 Tax=Sporomusa acidovorans (strain ATCC 49682 / DSM 3132 / Mol) TaxID=1123286 RepID=A0ABZ3J4H1_SPOA4|nr:hypothetical protein [Sporomusa acidovorans]OZC20332.1 hypothetical protein SPACI_27310 [Sporomusa acidovorans DSM 3132]SDD37303.1 hypothetical protein SAMN04488499_100152 [Sporomusa acidovorans]
MPKRVSSKIASYIKPNQLQPQSTNSQGVVDLLQKINQKLENLQNSLVTGNSDNQSRQEIQPPIYQSQQKEGLNAPQSDADVSQELRNLFSSLLTQEKQQNTLPNNGNMEQQNLAQNQSQQQNQAAEQGNNQNNSITVQTAAQVLAQAQYELSNELEASLQKLKQVISESEKIANKISNLLGEENNQQQ